MKKILLIYPYCLEERLHAEDAGIVPMGVYYIGALLKEHHYDVEILNFHNIRSPQAIQEILRAKQPDIIGFSILNANRHGGIEIARIARQINPGVKIVFGGVGASFLWEHFLTHFKDIDAVVIGEGEYPFLNLVKCFESKDDSQLENIRGIAFRREDKIIKTDDSEFIRDLDSLPVPARYFTYQHLSLTRGCPGNCTFCGSPQFWKRKVRFHSPEYFVSQIEILYKKGVRFFFVSDDMFMLRSGYVIEICKKILERNIKISWAAISHVSHVNEEVLYWMRRAGCDQISYGVESGSERIRNLLNKPIKKEQIKKAFSMTVRYGILARAYFIYGCPVESWETVQETIDLIEDIKPLSIIFYILDIFPGTALYEDFKRRSSEKPESENRAFDDIWLKQIEDMLYFETDPDLSEDMILRFGEKLRMSYYNALPDFADKIEVIADKEFYELHADFFSKLGMTFSHGDYANIEGIRNKDGVAERLYQRASDFYPNYRAYLGLGIIRQKNLAYQESVNILSKGLYYFPESEPLNICMGISLMNMGEYDKALPYFLKFRDSEAAAYYISECQKASLNNGL